MQDENIALYQKRIGCTIEALASELQRVVRDVVKEAKVTCRIKDPETLRNKILLKKAGDVFSIHDVYGLRVIVESVEEAYLVLGRIREHFSGRLADDFIAHPKAWSDPGFEGKSLRLLRLVAQENGASYEIQVTTSAFHEVNESHHEVYHRNRYPT